MSNQFNDRSNSPLPDPPNEGAAPMDNYQNQTMPQHLGRNDTLAQHPGQQQNVISAALVGESWATASILHGQDTDFFSWDQDTNNNDELLARHNEDLDEQILRETLLGFLRAEEEPETMSGASETFTQDVQPITSNDPSAHTRDMSIQEATLLGIADPRSSFGDVQSSLDFTRPSYGSKESPFGIPMPSDGDNQPASGLAPTVQEADTPIGENNPPTGRIKTCSSRNPNYDPKKNETGMSPPVLTQQPKVAIPKLPVSSTQESTRSANTGRDKFTNAPPVNVVDPNVALTVPEILTFFPRMLRLQDGALHVMQADDSWNPSTIARYIQNARGLTELRSSVSHMLTKAVRNVSGNPKEQIVPWRKNQGVDFQQPPLPWDDEGDDCLLKDVAKGVRVYPEGNEAGLFTQVIRAAIADTSANHKLSDVVTLIAQLP